MKREILLWLLNILPSNVSHKLTRKYVQSNIKKYGNLKVEGFEKIKNIEGPIIFIANHLSNSDGLIINEILYGTNTTFVAGVKLADNDFTNKGIGYVKTIPIKPNSADKDAINKIVQTLKRGENIMIFPEGTRSRTGKMIEAKKGLLLIAKLSKAKIVPIGITGSEKFLPINDKDMGEEKFSKANVIVRFGDYFYMPEKNKDEDKNEYTERALREVMVKVAELVPKEYRGVYEIECE